MQTALETLDGRMPALERNASQWIVRFLPSMTDLVFLLPLFLLFGLLPGSKLLLTDADLGWHIRTGEWILDHHAVPNTDLFSFTRSGAPWFAWEWGWDICFGAVHRVAGLGGIVAINALILSLVSVLAFRLVRRSCGNDLISFVVTGLAICGSTVHWLARPHLTSWLFFLAFAHLISRAIEGKSRNLLYLPLLTILWTNLHGSFFLGIAMVGMAALDPWIDWALHSGSLKPTWLRSRNFSICLVLCLVATFVNPYGWRLHEHVLRYLGDSKQMDMMQEFQSMNFHHAPAPFFEVMLLLGAASLVWCAVHREWYGLMTVLLWAHLGLFAGRNVPMYLFLSAPWIGCMLSDALSCDNRLARALRRQSDHLTLEFQPLERIERFYILAATGFAFTALSIAAGTPGFQPKFSPKQFPESALKIIDRYHAQRVFANDQWSAYLIYQRAPAVKVFVDDRSDFYGTAWLERTAHILNARWDWEADLLRFSTDMVIVAPDAPLATVLKSSPRWQLVLDDKSVVVFASRFIPAVNQLGRASPAQESSAVASNGGSKLGV